MRMDLFYSRTMAAMHASGDKKHSLKVNTLLQRSATAQSGTYNFIENLRWMIVRKSYVHGKQC